MVLDEGENAGPPPSGEQKWRDILLDNRRDRFAHDVEGLLYEADPHAAASILRLEDPREMLDLAAHPRVLALELIDLKRQHQRPREKAVIVRE
jgi:hypothetical protein